MSTLRFESVTMSIELQVLLVSSLKFNLKSNSHVKFRLLSDAWSLFTPLSDVLGSLDISFRVLYLCCTCVIPVVLYYNFSSVECLHFWNGVHMEMH